MTERNVSALVLNFRRRLMADSYFRGDKGKSAMAQKKSSRVVLRDDMLFSAHTYNNYTIPLDSARESGGHNAGVSPMELMLTSLAGCTAMDVISILRKKRQDVTAFEVEVSGLRADEHPRVWVELWVKFIVTGRHVDPKAVERSIELSRDQYCGAAATLRHTATIHYDYDIIEAEEVS
jgi:putative redox protein